MPLRRHGRAVLYGLRQRACVLGENCAGGIVLSKFCLGSKVNPHATVRVQALERVQLMFPMHLLVSSTTPFRRLQSAEITGGLNAQVG
jgi:hypothetical protein